jgi:pSer/pThr/pTyr-binding forkhead associated (FHA) protein
MIQLTILSGKLAGTPWVARQFPVHIGRTADNDLQLEEDGVWNQHAEINFDRTGGFLLAAKPDALVTLNGQPVQGARLRNGDSLQIGSVQIRFWLAATRQRGLRRREFAIWALLMIITLVEAAVICSLP